MDPKASRLKSASFSLYEIHLGTAKLQHAVREHEREQWQEYFPTHFIYAFFAFNSMYNVDWNTSYETGHIKAVSKVQAIIKGKQMLVEEKEGNKQAKYLSFCFKDSKFVRLYKDFFIRCVLKGGTKEDVREILSEIRLDNGGVRNEGYVKKFLIAVDDLLLRDCFDKDTVAKILDFIYSVRCNIFHGIKSIDEMKDYGQQDRLDVYACFIVALNQMAFSYLDYLNQKETFTESFDELYLRLM